MEEAAARGRSCTRGVGQLLSVVFRNPVSHIEALQQNRVDATVFTSASQAHNLFAFAESLGRAGSLASNLKRTPVASIGPVCSAGLKGHGVRVALEASPPKLGPLSRRSTTRSVLRGNPAFTPFGSASRLLRPNPPPFRDDSESPLSHRR